MLLNSEKKIRCGLVIGHKISAENFAMVQKSAKFFANETARLFAPLPQMTFACKFAPASIAQGAQ